MELRTARLVLREFQASDVEAFFAYQTRPEYLEYNGRTAPSWADVEAFVELMIQWRDEVPRSRYQLVITLEGRAIGTCGVRKETPESVEAEYGCELAPAHWGHGYALEASRAILEFGAALGVTTFVALTTEENVPALRLAEALGFQCNASGRCEKSVLRP